MKKLRNKKNQAFSVSVVVIAIAAVTFFFFIYLYVFRKFNGESIKSYARRTLDERITMFILMVFNAFYMCSMCVCVFTVYASIEHYSMQYVLINVRRGQRAPKIDFPRRIHMVFLTLYRFSLSLFISHILSH